MDKVEAYYLDADVTPIILDFYEIESTITINKLMKPLCVFVGVADVNCVEFVFCFKVHDSWGFDHTRDKLFSRIGGTKSAACIFKCNNDNFKDKAGKISNLRGVY